MTNTSATGRSYRFGLSNCCGNGPQTGQTERADARQGPGCRPGRELPGVWGDQSDRSGSPDERIVAGHARWEAAKQLKLDAIPVLEVGHLSEDELRLYAIADNRIAERAGWDGI